MYLHPHGLKKFASDRIISMEEVCQREPELILASWRGRRLRKAIIVADPDGIESPLFEEIAFIKSRPGHSATGIQARTRL